MTPPILDLKVGENMALSSITVEISNNQYRGGIEIKITAATASLGDINKLVVNRKTGNTMIWENNIFEKTISSISDLNCELFDVLTQSGKKYTYNVELMSGSTAVEFNTFPSVDCWFCGMFIGDFNEQYMAGSNFTVETTRNTQVSFVTTLSGRTPYRVSNANTNYTSGSANGLFLELTSDNKRFKPDDNFEYNKRVIDFLTNGNNKILKMEDGRIWYVAIDGNPSTPHNDNYQGMNSIDFKWVEIDNLPTQGMAVA